MQRHPLIDDPTQVRRAAGRPRKEDLAHRIDHLIACAGNLFLQKGYHKVSLHLIAREAGVAVRTIYLKFGGKAGLFNAVVRAHRDSFFTGMPPMDPGGRPIREVLFDFAHRYVNLVTSERALALQRLVIAEVPYAPEAGITFMQAAIEPTLALLADFFARDEVRVHMRTDIEPLQMARNLITCLLGEHVRHLLLNGTTCPAGVPDTDVRAAISLFLDGSCKPALPDTFYARAS